QASRRLSCSRQQLEERVEALQIEWPLWRELPQNRAELVLELEHARGEEVCERRLDVAQLLHVGDEARALDREHEPRGRLGVPARKRIGTLEAVERAVDLDRVELPARVLELAPVCEPFGIEHAPPVGVRPTRDPDPDLGGQAGRATSRT